MEDKCKRFGVKNLDALPTVESAGAIVSHWEEKWSTAAIIYGVAAYLVMGSYIGAITLWAMLWLVAHYGSFLSGRHLAKTREALTTIALEITSIGCVLLSLNGYISYALAIPLALIFLLVSATIGSRVERGMEMPSARSFLEALVVTCFTGFFIVAVPRWETAVVLHIGLLHALILTIAIMRNLRLLTTKAEVKIEDAGRDVKFTAIFEVKKDYEIAWTSGGSAYVSVLHGLQGAKAVIYALKQPTVFLGIFLLLCEIIYMAIAHSVY